MSKKYIYSRGERQAEREIEKFLRQVNHNDSLSSPAETSVLDELRALAAEA